MRSQYPVVAPPTITGQQVKRIGVYDQRPLRCDSRLPQRPRPVITPQPRPDCDHACGAQQRHQGLRGIDAVDHDLRPRGQRRRHVCRPGRQADQPSPGAQRRLGSQPCRTAEAVVATDGQHVAEVPLVRTAPARRQQVGLAGPIDPARRQHGAGEHRGRHLETGEDHASRTVRPVGGEQALFEADEAHRYVGADGTAENASTVGMQARRDIDRQNRGAVRIGRVDGARVVANQVALQPGAQHRVDNDVDLPRQAVERCRATPGRVPAARIQRRVTLQARGIAQLQHADLEPLLQGQPGNDVSVATVVAAPDKHGDVARSRPGFSQALEGSATGPLHQRLAGDAETLDRQAIEFPHLGGGVERSRQLVSGWQDAVGHWRSKQVSFRRWNRSATSISTTS